MSLSIITVSQRAAPALLGIVGIYATRGMRVASSRGFASTTHNNIKMTNGSLQSRRHMSNIPINTNAHDHHKHSAPQAETITMQHIAEKLGQVAGDVRELRGDVVRLKGQQPAQAAAETPPQRDWAAEWRSKLYDLNDDYQALKTVVAKTKTDMHAAANAAAGSASAAESASRVEAAAAAATAAAQASSSSSSSSSSTASHPYAEWHRQYDKNRWQSHCGAKRGLWGWIKIAFIAYAGYHVTKTDSRRSVAARSTTSSHETAK
jgi:hypothetical protein